MAEDGSMENRDVDQMEELRERMTALGGYL
jgi:hypothetical protein